MNKILKYILTITILFSVFCINNVYAYGGFNEEKTYNKNYLPDWAKKQGCELTCQYENNQCNFKSSSALPGVKRRYASIYYCPNQSKYFAVWMLESTSGEKGTVYYGFINDKSTKNDVLISKEDLTNLASGTCPARGYVSNGDVPATCFGTESYCKQQSGFWKKFQDSKELMRDNTECTETKSDGTTAEAKTNITDDNAAEIADKYHINRIDVTDNTNYKSCSDLIGGHTLQIIQKFFKIVYIITPFLVLLLGMLDLGKAVLSSKDDEMQKAKGRFVKRIIMGVAVFLVPTIINILFYVVNFAKDPSDSGNFFNYVRGDICIDD